MTCQYAFPVDTSPAVLTKPMSKIPLVTQTKAFQRMGHTITFLKNRLGFRQGQASTRCSQPCTCNNKLHREATSALLRPQVHMAAVVNKASLTECCLPALL